MLVVWAVLSLSAQEPTAELPERHARAVRPRLDAGWATPVNLGAPINVPEDDGAPALAKDGRTLYFDSDRPGGQGGRDLYVATASRR